MFGEVVLKSCEGVQQGDPLGPFLFSLGIQDIVKNMKSELNVFYLDDGTLGGEVETVLEDLLKIKEIVNSHGLELNPTKCELFLVNPEDDMYVTNIRNHFNEVCKGIKVVQEQNLSLLGAPKLAEAIGSILEPKLENLRLMTSRLKEIDNHEALFLLRHCFAIPKLTYFLRTAPCFMNESLLGNFDNTIKESLVDILNTSLSDFSYNQLTLPITKGGLGLRLTSEVALSGYLSSVCATKSTVRLLLPTNVMSESDIFWDRAFDTWKQITFQSTAPQNPIYQSNWDKEIYEFNYQKLLTLAPNKVEKASLLAVSSENSSDWLYALPIASLGLKLDPMTLKISCGLRLGSPICHQYHCVCGVLVEPFGRHGLSCRFQMGRRSRHDQINNLLKRALVQAKISAINEPSNLSRQDGKRPDGLTLTTWKYSKCLIWDTTVADTVSQSYVDQCSKNAGAAAETRENIKSSKYTELAQTYLFTPIGIETFGSWGSEGHKIVKEIGKKVMEETGEKKSAFFLFQSISIAIQRGNASCIIRTVPHTEGLDEIFEFESCI